MAKFLFSIFLLQFALVIISFAGDLTISQVEGSCEERCHLNYNTSDECHCDHSCVRYKNCCEDYTYICLPDRNNSCFGRCSGSNEYINSSCSCHADCVTNGSCCEDFLSVCSGSVKCEWLCSASLDSSAQCDCDTNCSYSCCKDEVKECRVVFGPNITVHSDPICPDRTPSEPCPTVSADVTTTSGGNANIGKYSNVLLISLSFFMTAVMIIAF